MGSRNAATWMEMAKSCIDGSVVLSRKNTARSAVSRAYYACHAAAHAVIVHLEPTAVGSRSIPHGELPIEFQRVVSACIPDRGKASSRLASELGAVYSARKHADYHPESDVDSDAVNEAIRCAGRFFRFAREVFE